MKLLALAIALLPIAPAMAIREDTVAVPVVGKPALPPVDPARLAIARKLAIRVLPDGAYRKVMGPMMNGLMGSVGNNVMSMPVRDVARMAGLDESKLQALGPGTLRQIAEIIDPAVESRMQISMKVMTDGVIDIVAAMEPDLREGVAEAYARNFTLDQLDDIDRFFQSPSGTVYAQRAMLLATDPAMMQRAQAMMPKIVEAMPALQLKIREATASLPKQRKPEELSPAEKAKLAQLMGIDPTKVK